MRKLEQPPKWPQESLKEGYSLWFDKTFKPLFEKINEHYYYWDKVKYQKVPQKTDPKVLWSAVKFGRSIHAKILRFGSYEFSYNLTGYIQKSLHEFDLNLGGQLGTRGLIPESDKKQYLISSIMEEAIASSQIEGAATTRKNAKDMLRKNNKPRNKSEQMILNNYITINRILEIQNEQLTEESLFEIHRLITKNTLDDDKDEGTYRTTNDVNVVDVIDGEVMYEPPGFNELPELMRDLFDFFNNNDKTNFVHPIIKACIVHFMIGFIHPFVDGNGRTARALFYWYLLKNDYWLTEYLSISRLIVRSKSAYAKAYLHSEADNNDLTYFIHYKLKTMKLAYESLRDYIQRKISEKKHYIHFQKISGINERQALILKWLYEEKNILLTVKELQTRLNTSNQTARADLDKLVEMDFLEIIPMNQKTKAYGKSKNFDLLVQEKIV